MNTRWTHFSAADKVKALENIRQITLEEERDHRLMIKEENLIIIDEDLRIIDEDLRIIEDNYERVDIWGSHWVEERKRRVREVFA